MGSNNKVFSISTSSQSFDGKLDDLRYYNRALSESEVGQVYGEQATNRVYMADALGSIVALTDDSRTQRSQFNYEPFGTTTVTGDANESSPYRFTSRESDPLTGGLYYYRARYYHPEMGRFISEDPIEYAGGDTQLYAYVGSQPIAFTDPLGLVLDLGRNEKEINQAGDLLQILRRSPTAREIIRELMGSLNTHLVRPTSSTSCAGQETRARRPMDSANPGPNVDTVTKYNPNGIRGFPPDVILIHELAHAYERLRGTYDRSAPEDFAKRIENQVRSEMGYLPRNDADCECN